MGFAPKDWAISTNDGLICLTPARVFKMIIHIAKSVVVMTMDFNPKPNKAEKPTRIAPMLNILIFPSFFQSNLQLKSFSTLFSYI